MLGGPGVLKVAQDLWGMNCKLVLQIRLLQNFYRKYSVPLRASLDLSSLCLGWRHTGIVMEGSSSTVYKTSLLIMLYFKLEINSTVFYRLA